MMICFSTYQTGGGHSFGIGARAVWETCLLEAWCMSLTEWVLTTNPLEDAYVHQIGKSRMLYFPLIPEYFTVCPAFSNMSKLIERVEYIFRMLRIPRQLQNLKSRSNRQLVLNIQRTKETHNKMSDSGTYNGIFPPTIECLILKYKHSDLSLIIEFWYTHTGILPPTTEYWILVYTLGFFHPQHNVWFLYSTLEFSHQQCLVLVYIHWNFAKMLWSSCSKVRNTE